MAPRPRSGAPETPEPPMLDMFFIALVAGFFFAAALGVRLLERL